MQNKFDRDSERDPIIKALKSIEGILDCNCLVNGETSMMLATLCSYMLGSLARRFTAIHDYASVAPITRRMKRMDLVVRKYKDHLANKPYQRAASGVASVVTYNMWALGADAFIEKQYYEEKEDIPSRRKNKGKGRAIETGESSRMQIERIS